MIRWSLAAELLALIIIIFLMLHYYERKLAANYRRKMYRLCLWMSVLTILLNILCVHTISIASRIPLWINMALNSAYFMLAVFLCTVVSVYLATLILEHVYSRICIRRFLIMAAALNALYLLLVLWNLKSGVLFYFDGHMSYQRGPLNSAGYVVMGIEVLMLSTCYLRNRPSVGKSVVRLIRTMPILAAALIYFQHEYPYLLINGMFAAITDMIIYISFQSSWNERDSLTGIGNRNSFFQEIALRIAGHQQFQVILVALKNFSSINQKFSYKQGDEFLYVIADRLDHILPQSRAFRFANVEFAILLPYDSEENAYDNIGKIRDRFNHPWNQGKVSCNINALFTDFVYTGQEWNPAQVIEFLEYGIESAGESPEGLKRFDSSMLHHLMRRKQLIEIMQYSIEHKRFKVWYQPVYSLEDNCFSSAEALLRLKDYDGNPVSPGEFIPIAEEKGMIDNLFWIVLEEVCLLLQRTPGQIKSISINLSMQQFEDRTLLERMKQCLDKYHLTPERLKIEITERVLLQDMEYMKMMMEELTKSGICFYLDDFGTGYSNISCVLSLPFEYIKLDKSLLKGIPGDRKAELLVKSMVKTFRSMGLKIVAEGVEEKEQAEMLKEFEVSSIQGYYYGKPMPEEEFLEYILPIKGGV